MSFFFFLHEYVVKTDMKTISTQHLTALGILSVVFLTAFFMRY